MFCLLCCFSLSYEKVTIARSGVNASYTIVVPSVNGIVQKYHNYAAKQLQKFIENITTVKLNITTDDCELPEHAILIGVTKYSKQIAPELRDIDKDLDAFHLIVKGNYVLLNGGSRGVVYGVYETLERYGKVRFFATYMLVVPKAETFDLPKELDFYSCASLQYRESYDMDLGEDYSWYSYERYDSGECYITPEMGGNYFRGSGVHSILNLISSSKYPISRYPERYALTREGGTDRTYTQACLSNEDNYKEILNNIKSKNYESFVEVSQNDGNEWCHCSKCLAKYIKYGNRTSGLWIDLINRLANDLASERPNLHFRTLAYVNTNLPPKNIKVHKNVIIRLCEYSNNHAIPVEESNYPGSKEFMEALKGWTEIASKVMVWMYPINYMDSTLIHPTWFTISRDIQTFAKYGVWGVFFDGTAAQRNGIGRMFSDFDKMNNYAVMKSSWNASLDPDDIMNDFLRLYYGPKAAPYIRQYLDEAYGLVKKFTKGPLYIDAFINYQVFEPLRSPFLEHGYELWQRAIEAARTDSDPRYLYNTQTGSITLKMSIYRYYKDYVIPAEWTAKSIKFKPPKILGEIAKDIPEYCPSMTVPDPRSNRYCYLGQKDSNELEVRNFFSNLTTEFTPYTISCGESTFGSKGGRFYGRGGLLLYKNWNYLDYTNGGFDFNVMSGTNQINITYNVLFSDDAQSYQYSMLNYAISKKYAASGNGVKGTFTCTSNKGTSPFMSNVVTASLNLGSDGASVVWQTADNKWKGFALADSEESRLVGFKNNAQQFTVASPTTKKGVKFVLSQQPEGVSIKLNRTSKVLTVYIVFRKTNVATVTYQATLTPLTDVTGFTAPSKNTDVYKGGLQWFEQDLLYSDMAVAYHGGDDDAYGGCAIILAAYKKFFNVTVPNQEPNQIHLYDIYNFSFHVRCDVTNASADSFSIGFMDDYEGMWVNRVTGKNASSYKWYSAGEKNITHTTRFYLLLKEGSSKCYVDCIRAEPVKLMPFTAEAAPTFQEVRDLDPMPEVDLYKLNRVTNDASKSGNGPKVAAICVFTILGIGIVCIIGAILYRRKYGPLDKKSEDDKNDDGKDVLGVRIIV